MFLIGFLAFFVNAYQYQNAFELCLEKKFDSKRCEFHKKMVELNHKSKYHND